MFARLSSQDTRSHTLINHSQTFTSSLQSHVASIDVSLKIDNTYAITISQSTRREIGITPITDMTIRWIVELYALVSSRWSILGVRKVSKRVFIGAEYIAVASPNSNSCSKPTSYIFETISQLVEGLILRHWLRSVTFIRVRCGKSES